MTIAGTAALTEFWKKCKDAFASSSHSHSVVTSSTNGLMSPTMLAQLEAAVGSAETATDGFLAAHPPGTYYLTTDASDPGETYGGTWEYIGTDLGCHAWHRLDDAATIDDAAAFLVSHPVGSYYLSSSPSNPGSTYGGTWVSVEASGMPYVWHRTE